jgi:hypothetical protein
LEAGTHGGNERQQPSDMHYTTTHKAVEDNDDNRSLSNQTSRIGTAPMSLLRKLTRSMMTSCSGLRLLAGAAQLHTANIRDNQNEAPPKRDEINQNCRNDEMGSSTDPSEPHPFKWGTGKHKAQQ